MHKSKRLSIRSSLVFMLILLFFGIFLIYPLAHLLKTTFGGTGEGMLTYFKLIVSSPLQIRCLFNSFFIAILITLLTTVVALPMAHWFTRYDFPVKRWVQPFLLVPMIMPPFVGAIGVKQLFSRFGSLNLFLDKIGLVPLQHPIDWLGGSGFWGIIVLGTLHLYPIMFLNLQAAMAHLDVSLLEAAEGLGARPFHILRTITLPLIMPGYFAGAIIVFIWAFTDLGTPLIFGFDRVIPMQIFNNLTEIHTNPMGYTLVVFTLFLTLSLFLISKAFMGRKRYEIISGRHGMSSQKQASGIQSCLILAVICGISLLALLPHISVILQSLSGRWFFTILPEEWTIDNYQSVFAHSLTLTSIKNSLFLSSMCALLDLVLGMLIAYLIVRKQTPGGNVLDILAMLPLALPGLVIAFSYVACFHFPMQPSQQYPFWYRWLNQLMDPTVNPTLLLIMSYSIRRLPYIVRIAYAGFQQTSITLEEASFNLGATTWHTIRRITLPLMVANVIAGAIMTFSFAMLEVSDSLILAQKERYFPITKAIYTLIALINPNAPSMACALGVLGMILLTTALFITSKILGKRIGSLFRI
ncbi:MAG: iron ABC transporter permease [Candidatus Jettenia sp. CY-1]|nr:MAG: iron ABC transporter permease [Candidatus Jettenia sp. CY-1]